MYRQSDNRRFPPDGRQQSQFNRSDDRKPMDCGRSTTQYSQGFGNASGDYQQPRHRSPPRGGYPDGSNHRTPSMDRMRNRDAYGPQPNIPRPSFNPSFNKNTNNYMDKPPRQQNDLHLRTAKSSTEDNRKPYRPESPPLYYPDDEDLQELIPPHKLAAYRSQKQKNESNYSGRSALSHHDLNRNNYNDRPRNDRSDARPPMPQERGNGNRDDSDWQRGRGGPRDEFDTRRQMLQTQSNYREDADWPRGRGAVRNDDDMICDSLANMAMAGNRSNGGSRIQKQNDHHSININRGGFRNDFARGDVPFNPLVFNCQENERRGYYDMQGGDFRNHSRRNADEFFLQNERRRRDGCGGDRGRQEMDGRGTCGHDMRGEGRKYGEEKEYDKRGGSGSYRNGRNDEYGEKKYDCYGEVRGNLEFKNNGGGEQVNGRSDDQFQRDQKYVEKAPPGWVPQENSLDELFKNDKLNVAQLRAVEEESIVTGDEEFKEFDSWENSGLHGHLIDVLKSKCGFEKPKKIQVAAIKEIMAGKDVVAQAVTGSGKTFAFVLPIVDKIMKMTLEERGRSAHAPLAIILEPTRELAVQVYDVFRRVTHDTDIRCVRVIGQMDRWEVRSSLSRGVDIYVGTVGRLMRLQCNGDIDLHRLKFFVLDEVDKIMNTHDCEQLQTFMDTDSFRKTTDQRQTLLFSATLPQECVDMAKKVMKQGYVRIENKEAKANGLVQQVYMETKGKFAKNSALKGIFEKDKEDGKDVKTLIFVGSRKQSDFLSFELVNMGFGAVSINGDRPQNVRDEAYHNFMNGTINILVGTDVCSRGWDIPTLHRVINYDLPMPGIVGAESAIDKFIHRIGRTGRVKEGTAVTFVDPWKDAEMAKDLVTICREVGQTPPDFLLELSGEPVPSDAVTSETDTFTPPPGLPHPEDEKESLDASADRNSEVKNGADLSETPILGGGSDDDSHSERVEEEERSEEGEKTEEAAKGGKEKKD